MPHLRILLGHDARHVQYVGHVHHEPVLTRGRKAIRPQFNAGIKDRVNRYRRVLSTLSGAVFGVGTSLELQAKVSSSNDSHVIPTAYLPVEITAGMLWIRSRNLSWMSHAKKTVLAGRSFPRRFEPDVARVAIVGEVWSSGNKFKRGNLLKAEE